MIRIPGYTIPCINIIKLIPWYKLIAIIITLGLSFFMMVIGFNSKGLGFMSIFGTIQAVMAVIVFFIVLKEHRDIEMERRERERPGVICSGTVGTWDTVETPKFITTGLFTNVRDEEDERILKESIEESKRRQNGQRRTT
ncbi:MAG: hypothetical protein WC479_09715 [Candidatus Izemoplasmatales bacterium]